MQKVLAQKINFLFVTFDMLNSFIAFLLTGNFTRNFLSNAIFFAPDQIARKLAM